MLLANRELIDTAKRAGLYENANVRALVNCGTLPRDKQAKLMRYMSAVAARECPEPHPFLPGPTRDVAAAGKAHTGKVVTGRGPEYDFRLSEDHFQNHIQVDAPTGGGKSIILTHLSMQMHRVGTATWWIETEGDIAGYITAALPDVLVLNYKDLRLALFEGPESTGLDWLEYLSKLINVFRCIICSGDGMSNMMRDISIHLRERQGFFTLFDFVDELLRRKYKSRGREAMYWESLKNRFKGMIIPVLGQVYGAGSHDIRALMSRSIVWQLQGLSQDVLALWVTVLLLWLYLAAPITPEPTLRNLLVFDEFSRICKQQVRELPGMGDNFLIDFVQTSRKRGIGILLATQTPHLLPRAIMSNVNTSIVLRPTDGNFLRCVSQALDLDRDQEECLMELPDRHPRRAIVRCPGCPQPFMVELPEL